MKYELTDLNFIYKYFLMHIQLPVHFFFYHQVTTKFMSFALILEFCSLKSLNRLGGLCRATVIIKGE